MAEKKVSHKDKVQELYVERYKPLALAPKHVVAMKKLMEKASRKSGGNTKSIVAAATAFLKEKKIGLVVSKEKEKKAPQEEKPKHAKKGVKSPAVDILKKHEATAALKGDAMKGVPKGNIDMTKLNRAELKGMAKDLKVDFTKKTTDDELRELVSKQMIGLDKKVEESLDKADPAKVGDLKDCIGLFIDLTKATCIACPLQEQCRDLFEQHRQEGFVVFERLKKSGEAKPVKEDEPPKDKKLKNGFNADRQIECYDIGKIKELSKKVVVDGVEIENHMDHFKLLKQVKTDVPDTLGELAEIILSHYDPENDTEESKNELVMFFTHYFEKLGLISQV